MKPGQSEAHRNHKAAIATLEHYESQRRAATTERARFILDGAIDEAKARLRLATKALQKTVSLDLITSEFREALRAVVVEEEST